MRADIRIATDAMLIETLHPELPPGLQSDHARHGRPLRVTPLPLSVLDGNSLSLRLGGATPDRARLLVSYERDLYAQADELIRFSRLLRDHGRRLADCGAAEWWLDRHGNMVELDR